MRAANAQKLAPNQPHDSFFRWGFFNSVLEKKEGFFDYAFDDTAMEMLRDEPALQAQFEQWKRDHPALLSDQKAVLGCGADTEQPWRLSFLFWRRAVSLWHRFWSLMQTTPIYMPNAPIASAEYAQAATVFAAKETPLISPQLPPSLLQPLHTHRLRRAQLLRTETAAQLLPTVKRVRLAAFEGGSQRLFFLHSLGSRVLNGLIPREGPAPPLHGFAHPEYGRCA